MITRDKPHFQEYPGPSERVKKTLKVENQSVSLKENGIQLNLTVIDTPGFGDSVSFRFYLRSSSTFDRCRTRSRSTDQIFIFR